MPLLKPPKEEQQVKVKLNLDESLFNKVETYRKWAKFNSVNSVIIEAIKRIFKSDKEWNIYLKQLDNNTKKGGEKT